jgi:hypothetical protein
MPLFLSTGGKYAAEGVSYSGKYAAEGVSYIGKYAAEGVSNSGYYKQTIEICLVKNESHNLQLCPSSIYFQINFLFLCYYTSDLNYLVKLTQELRHFSPTFVGKQGSKVLT